MRFILLFLALLFVRACAKPYDEAVAKRMFVLSTAALSPQPEICLGNRFSNAQLVQRYEVDCDSSGLDTCSGYLALLNDDKVIAVVFRGSTSELQAKMQQVDSVLSKYGFLGLGNVNRYYHRAFWTLWNGGMGDRFTQLTNQHPDYAVWTTGHSLGAALSSLAALKIVNDGRYNDNNSLHYNFGQPRVGDQTYANSHKKLVRKEIKHTQSNFSLKIPDFYRVTHAQDEVTTWPTLNLGFVHHAGEIWYNNTMKRGSKHVFCHGDNEKACRGPRTSKADHLTYFNFQFNDYALQGCQTAIN
ncbi:Lipase-3 domain-containing protein [Aphelenchoides fujianensis]|nr:Lipase-3 domain-containing protein [Aphelenchoides fujianensis]